MPANERWKQCRKRVGQAPPRRMESGQEGNTAADPPAPPSGRLAQRVAASGRHGRSSEHGEATARMERKKGLYRQRPRGGGCSQANGCKGQDESVARRKPARAADITWNSTRVETSAKDRIAPSTRWLINRGVDLEEATSGVISRTVDLEEATSGVISRTVEKRAGQASAPAGAAAEVALAGRSDGDGTAMTLWLPGDDGGQDSLPTKERSRPRCQRGRLPESSPTSEPE
jgi:hypothetical protein